MLAALLALLVNYVVLCGWRNCKRRRRVEVRDAKTMSHTSYLVSGGRQTPVNNYQGSVEVFTTYVRYR